MKVIAIDPGPHVGIAFYWNGTFNSLALTDVEFYEDSNRVEAWLAEADVVVCENFIISGPRAREANETIEMIGVLRFLSRCHDSQFVEQAPADARVFSTNAKLQRLGWYQRGGSDHARSATRHLVLYLAKAGILGAELLHFPKEGEST